jgi:hypothetical protein
VESATDKRRTADARNRGSPNSTAARYTIRKHGPPLKVERRSCAIAVGIASINLSWFIALSLITRLGEVFCWNQCLLTTKRVTCIK